MSTQSPPAIPLPFQLSRMVTSYWVPQAIFTAAALGVADALAGGPKASGELARAVDADPDALGRLMRALVVLQLCTLTGDGRYELTPLGSCLRSDTPDSVRSWVLLVGGARVWSSWGRLAECVRAGRSVPALEGRDTWVAPVEDTGATSLFNQAMVELTRHLAGVIAGAYDFSEIGSIVDVGGGYGALLPPVLKANPRLRGIVFDLPQCRDGARALAEKTGVADRCEFVAGSFFDDPLPAAGAYIIKSVIHDWDDEHGVAILRRIHAAMDAAARLLVVEPIVPERVGTSPLDGMLAHTDLNMLVVTGGRERTEREYRALIERAGLRVTQVVPTPAAMSIIEGRKA